MIHDFYPPSIFGISCMSKYQTPSKMTVILVSNYKPKNSFFGFLFEVINSKKMVFNLFILFSDFEIDPNSFFNLTLEYIDTIVIIFFTFEYSIRFICAPRKWRFFKVYSKVNLKVYNPFRHTITVGILYWPTPK